MLKASENPSISWPEGQSICDFTGPWWVAHTKSRNEKALAHDLAAKEISYFLPMSWKVRRRKRRALRSLLPLFSGYLFFCGEEDERLEVLRTNRVANVIAVKDQEKLVDELSQIEHALRAGAPLTAHKYIKAGQKCRVIAGPLSDMHGIVVSSPERKRVYVTEPGKAKNIARLVLQIDMLGQAASVEIDIDMIEVIDNG